MYCVTSKEIFGLEIVVGMAFAKKMLVCLRLREVQIFCTIMNIVEHSIKVNLEDSW